MRVSVEVKGEGLPVVVVPGGLTGWLSWEPHASRLAASRRPVRVQLLSVQLGLEGEPLPADYSIRTESSMLLHVLDTFGFERPLDVVGWSFGGLVALDFALDHPARVRSLTLIEPPAFWVLRERDEFGRELARIEAQMRALTGDITPEQVAWFAETIGLVPAGKKASDQPWWNLWLVHRLSLRNGFAPFDHHDRLERLRSFDRPTLLVQGERATSDGSTPWAHRVMDALAQELPRVWRLELPAGHAPHLVSMDRFLATLGDFHRMVERGVWVMEAPRPEAPGP